MKLKRALRAAPLTCIALAAWIAPITAEARELLSSFAYVGCNRVGSGVENLAPSTANVAQFLQTFEDIQALPVKPKHFFFAGDLVLGMKSDGGRLLPRSSMPGRSCTTAVISQLVE
ncbi:hypothetical protein BOW53_02755 [Solemya pervernicosa gill symbiont]|uniref:Calcineurin-like phosphoesterase domain-containing protein n=1 Tax=Solemya pervernicosa gill symbiont TaxID=642797 RepID=A0A1T2L927_9GAMM|nr:hypothetical protein [Solemya pervernicosa gill symbiont]OOZ41618.1 hypothetical protein BOW53_02755 [Solemya pervernicosa gill symbiont]